MSKSPCSRQSQEQNCSSFGGNSNLQKLWQEAECFTSILCLRVLVFTSLAQSKQDKSQELLTKSWDLICRYDSPNVVYTSKMSSYVSRNQAGLLMNKSSDFLFSPKGHIWHQPSYSAVGACEHVCSCTSTRHLQWLVTLCEMSLPTSSHQVYISMEHGHLCWRPFLSEMTCLCFVFQLDWPRLWKQSVFFSEQSLVIRWFQAMAILPPHSGLSWCFQC